MEIVGTGNQEVLNEKLLAALDDYARRLTSDHAQYIELRWNYYIKLAAVVSGAGLVLLAMASLEKYSTLHVGWELFFSVILALCAFLVILTAQFRRTQNRLVGQVRSAAYLCRRLAGRGTEMLEQSRLSNQDKFILEIRLFEADRAVNEAETTFNSADLSRARTYDIDEIYLSRIKPSLFAVLVTLIGLGTALVFFSSIFRKAP